MVGEIGESADSKSPICPFLGLKDDSTTALSFPSSGNHCFHAKPVLPVKLEFQGTHCLTAAHISCEEFIRTPNTPLLPNLRFERGSRLLKKSGKTRLWIFLLVIAIVILIVWQVFARGLSGSGHPGLASVSTLPVSSTKVGLSTLPISPTQSQNTPTPTILMTPSATLPIQTATLTILLPHALETPVGLEYKLIIHRVALGESLPSMATLYGTTAEAIQAVNYNLPLPLVVDRLVIVPINQTDVHGLPAFEAYEVKSDVVVETLAQQLSVDPSLLKLYNGLKDGEPLSTGDWLLIPHVGTATP